MSESSSEDEGIVLSDQAMHELNLICLGQGPEAREFFKQKIFKHPHVRLSMPTQQLLPTGEVVPVREPYAHPHVFRYCRFLPLTLSALDLCAAEQRRTV